MPRFELQFAPGRIPELAARFSYQGDATCREAGASAAARGHYTRDEFLTVCRWKTPRSGFRVASNEGQTVLDATRKALSNVSERERMEALITLDGVGVPTGSALLLFAFPDDYPILDIRALEALGVKGRTQYPLNFWLEYLEACRDLAREHGVPQRTLDKALWQYSKDRSQR